MEMDVDGELLAEAESAEEEMLTIMSMKKDMCRTRSRYCLKWGGDDEEIK